MLLHLLAESHPGLDELVVARSHRATIAIRRCVIHRTALLLKTRGLGARGIVTAWIAID
jgi:hypothetical protein